MRLPRIKHTSIENLINHNNIKGQLFSKSISFAGSLVILPIPWFKFEGEEVERKQKKQKYIGKVLTKPPSSLSFSKVNS